MQAVKQTANEVWVFAEQLEGTLSNVTLELIGAARALAADLCGTVATVLIGNQVDELIPTLFEHGTDTVYYVNAPIFQWYRAETYSRAFCELIQKYEPEILLMGATTTGRDLAGAVATALKTGLTADCTGLELDAGQKLLLASRPALGGNIMATIVCEKHRPQMATVRPKVMPMPERISGRTGTVIYEQVELREQSLKTKVLEIVREHSADTKMEDANIIVSVGRGVQNEHTLVLAQTLAEVLGGVVGGSRGAVEKGLVDDQHQVGQTGQTVRPKLYIAVGISGAIQHTVGMNRAQTIIAINTDETCPMMKLATYGIVGDAALVLPALIHEWTAALKPSIA
ncbi:MAG: Electron transfer flavoprotein alpha/beta-subunit [Oscillospiraceae bacterium]|nr:Electron transfer flavoprotein alpha/beta-subunit [Oscillospiraceae bacterium]